MLALLNFTSLERVSILNRGRHSAPRDLHGVCIAGEMLEVRASSIKSEKGRAVLHSGTTARLNNYIFSFPQINWSGISKAANTISRTDNYLLKKRKELLWLRW